VYNKLKDNSYFQTFLTLVLGASIGGLTFLFVNLLSDINAQQANLNLNVPFHLMLVPIIFIFLWLARRNSLYFPTKISELGTAPASRYWSKMMWPFHFVGTLLSHASGVSVGREGAVVLFSSALTRVFRLPWDFWGPILASIGFSSVIGNYWVAPIFMTEVFASTRLLQKLYAFIGAVAAVLTTRQLGMPHLFAAIEVTDDIGFFMKFVVLLAFAICVGYTMRFYKYFHKKLISYFFNSHLIIKILVCFVLAGILYWPQFRHLQSLGLSQIYDLNSLQPSISDSFLKLALTLVATTVAFVGGEFIPLVYSGVHFGGHFFSSWGYNMQLGAAMGAFLMFASGTRLMWTSYVLMIALLGWEWWFWVYFVLSAAIGASGDLSLYKTERDLSV
jgi:H+/Cl- antiporter ClcA